MTRENSIEFSPDSTPKALPNKAQGRVAHPGLVSGRVDGRVSPGCSARPFAVLWNTSGVRDDDARGCHRILPLIRRRATLMKQLPGDEHPGGLLPEIEKLFRQHSLD